MINIKWTDDDTDILTVNGKQIDDIMDSEDSCIIYSELEILEIVSKFLDNIDADDTYYEVIGEIKNKIEEDIELYACEWLL